MVSIRIQGGQNILKGTFTASGNRRFVNGNDELADWYKRNFKQGDNVVIEIISKNEYNLLKIK